MARNVGSSSSGSPSIVRNTCDGNGIENSLAKSISSWSTKPVDEVVDQRRDRRLEQRHLSRGEERIEDLPVLLVIRRVDLQGDQRPDVLEVDRRHVRGEDVRPAEHLVDLGSPAHQDRQVVERHDPGQLADAPGRSAEGCWRAHRSESRLLASLGSIPLGSIPYPSRVAPSWPDQVAGYREPSVAVVGPDAASAPSVGARQVKSEPPSTFTLAPVT